MKKHKRFHFRKMSKGEITYLVLWAITGVLLLTLIFLFVGFNAAGVTFDADFPDVNASQANGLAATGVLFAISLIAAIFSTVIVATKKKKMVSIKQSQMKGGRNDNA